jgi:dipeptidyl aminopeptidase/acylaminoacyl peptidase
MGLAAALAVLLPVCAAAADGKPSLSQYLNMRSTGAPSLSPDGSHYAFLWAVTGSAQVWITRVENGFPEQLTSFEDRVTFVDWAPVGDRIFFGKDSGGNEKTQLYVMNRDGSGVEALTSNPKAVHDYGSVSRDGRWLAYGANDRDERNFDVLVMDLQTKESRRLIAEDAPFAPGSFSPDGKYLLVARTDHSRNNDVYAVEVATGRRLHLTPHEGDSRFFGGEWLPDNRTVYLVTDHGRDRLSLAKVAVGPSPKLEFVDTGALEVEGVEVSWDGTWLAWAVNDEGRNRATVLNRKTGRALKLPKANVTGARFTADSRKIILATQSGRELTERHLFDPATNRVSQIGFASYAGVPRDSLVEPQLVRYPSFDGVEVPAWLYVPKGGAKDGTLPMIINYHGGPEGQSRPNLSPTVQYLVSRGYAVLQPNIRGSSGYGKAWLDADNGRNRRVSIQDAAAAAEWARQSGWANPKKLVAFGGSYGGYMTLCMVTFYPDYWAAGVDDVGMSDLASFLKNTGAYRARHRMGEYGNPETDAEFLRTVSPLHFADRIRAPMMIVQGANDPRCPRSEAEQIVEAIKKKGGTVEYVLFPDEGHGIAKLRNRIQWLTGMVEFLDKHVKGKTPVSTPASAR